MYSYAIVNVYVFRNKQISVLRLAQVEEY